MPVLRSCSCRWAGEKQVETCKLHAELGAYAGQLRDELADTDALWRREAEYAAAIVEAVSYVVTKYDDGFTADRATSMVGDLRAVLAKNPIPSGELESGGGYTPDASGPVGLGPACDACNGKGFTTRSGPGFVSSATCQKCFGKTLLQNAPLTVKLPQEADRG